MTRSGPVVRVTVFGRFECQIGRLRPDGRPSRARSRAERQGRDRRTAVFLQRPGWWAPLPPFPAFRGSLRPREGSAFPRLNLLEAQELERPRPRPWVGLKIEAPATRDAPEEISRLVCRVLVTAAPGRGRRRLRARLVLGLKTPHTIGLGPRRGPSPSDPRPYFHGVGVLPSGLAGSFGASASSWACLIPEIEGDRLLGLIRSQEPEHSMNRADLDHRFARLGEPLVIPAIPPIATEPGEGPLHPAPWQLHEPLRTEWTSHHLDPVVDLRPLEPGLQVVVVVLPVGPEQLQPGAVLGR